MNTNKDTRRFAKDITTEIDIIDENRKLKKINEELNKCLIIKEKEIESLNENNKLIKQQNEILKGIIKNHNIKELDINLVETTTINNIKENIKQDIPSPPISPENVRNNIFNENVDISKENIKNNETVNVEKVDENKHKQTLLKQYNIKNGESDSHQTDKLNMNEFVRKKYPIKKYTDIGESEIKKLIAAEVLFKIRYQNKIAFMANDNTEHINMEEVINYIVKQENLSKEKAKCLRYKLKRCKKLYDTLGDKLSIFKFHMSWIENMPEEKWKLWCKYLEEEVYEVYGDLPICKYIFLKGNNKGMKCNKVNCNNHQITEID